jgi:hypothetical protein
MRADLACYRPSQHHVRRIALDIEAALDTDLEDIGASES